jgi:hypothetical protein
LIPASDISFYTVYNPHTHIYNQLLVKNKGIDDADSRGLPYKVIDHHPLKVGRTFFFIRLKIEEKVGFDDGAPCGMEHYTFKVKSHDGKILLEDIEYTQIDRIAKQIFKSERPRRKLLCPLV